MQLKLLNLLHNFSDEDQFVKRASFKKNRFMDDEGLFSEVLFGPINSYRCRCIKPVLLKEGEKCPNCSIEYTSSIARRYKFSKIRLPFYIIHPFIFDKLEKHKIKNIIFDLLKGISYKIDKNNKLVECDKNEAEFIYFKNIEKLIEFLLQDQNDLLSKFIYENRNYIKCNSLIVIPPEFRPFKDGKFLDNINELYSTIVSYCNIIESSEIYVENFNEYIVENEVPKDVIYKFIIGLQIQIKKLYEYCIDKIGKKNGLLRGNMLGKRVDFSGRSVIIVDPIIPLTHCGIPYIMLLELFKLNLANILTETCEYISIQSAIEDIDQCIESGEYNKFKNHIDKIVENEWVILNRQPSLHRLSMMAFKIKPIDGYCISINPLITPPYGADFDGDQMALYVVLNKKSKKECEEKLWSIKQLLNASNNEIVFTPNQDVILGIYQLTRNNLNIKEHLEKRKYKNKDISLGRYIFNSILPNNYPLMDTTINKKKLLNIIQDITLNYKEFDVPKLLDDIKKLGFKYSTLYPITFKISGFDVDKMINKQYKKENIFNSNLKYENYKNEMELLNSLKEKFLYKDLIESGSRGNWSQAKQLFLSRGYIADINNKIIDEPIISSNYEGLTQKEYFLSCYGTRKGLIDTAENTSKSGYLTRTLVYALAGLEINTMNEDCKTNKTLNILVKNEKHLQSLHNRYILDDNNEIKKITMYDKDLIGKNIKLRSPIGCLDKKGICKTCLGDLYELFRSKYLGIITAQSLGEVSTQMVLRTFHISGAASMDDKKGEQSDIISDIKKLFDILLYTKNEYFTSNEELLDYIFNIYSNYSNILHIHFEVLLSQMLWYEIKKNVYKKYRLVIEPQRENIRFISCKKVPTYESWFLGCLYSNISKNLLRAFLENKKANENILVRICTGDLV